MNLGREVVKELPGTNDLSHALSTGLTLLLGEQFTEFSAAIDEFGADGHQHLIAGFHGRLAPFFCRTIGTGDSMVSQFGRCLRIATD